MQQTKHLTPDEWIMENMLGGVSKFSKGTVLELLQSYHDYALDEGIKLANHLYPNSPEDNAVGIRILLNLKQNK